GFSAGGVGVAGSALGLLLAGGRGAAAAGRRGRVRQRRGVARGRPRGEPGQGAGAALLRLGLSDGGPRDREAGAGDRLRRARLLARRHDLAVPDRPRLPLRVVPRAVDPLDAVRALLHDAAAADRDLRVAAELLDLGREVLVEVEVEAPDLVRAVVRA